MKLGFLVAVLFCLADSAAGQPASDLLQSGIYSQDTLGDLNAAIRIYRQILDSGSGLRLYAAQAEYRLGTCLLRKGDRAGAAEAFQSVIRDYPDQPVLVARARESLPPGNDLLRAPWAETEVAEYRWTIPGTQDGWSICRVGPAVQDSSLRIQMSVYAPRLFVTQVDVDRKTMRPLLVSFRAPPSSNLSSEYPSGLDRSKAGNAAYEYGELLYLLRRMPLGSGWSSTIPLIAEQNTPFHLKATVTGYEDVAVPAGSFKCFRVLLSGDTPRHSVVGTDWPVPAAGETLWFGASGARPLVKIESGQFRGELASLRTAEQIGTSSYRDPQVGYSFTVPAGWIFHPRSSFNPPGTSVDLLDPEARVLVVISAKSKETERNRIDRELQAGALERLKTTRRSLKHYALRGAMTRGQLGGHASIAWIADYTAKGRKWVEYLTWVQSDATRASIAVQVDAADFDRFRERFQPILDSFRMP
jgi:tetratricopeptide (TPR) repeat protein